MKRRLQQVHQKGTHSRGVLAGMEQFSHLDTRLPLGECQRYTDSVSKPASPRALYGTHTIRDTQGTCKDLRELEQAYSKEQVQVQSYVKMIRRIEREIEALQQENQSIAGRVVEHQQRRGEMQARFEEEQTRHLIEMNELLNEAERQEKYVSSILDQKNEVTAEDIEYLEQEVDNMKNELAQEEKKSVRQFSGLVSFIDFLERSNAGLCEAIESLNGQKQPQQIFVQEYDE